MVLGYASFQLSSHIETCAAVRLDRHVVHTLDSFSKLTVRRGVDLHVRSARMKSVAKLPVCGGEL